MMKAKAIPEGYRTITPLFLVRDAARYIQFLKQAFDAKDTYVAKMPDGSVMSAEVRVGDSMIMVADADEDYPGGEMVRASTYMYVDDVDGVYKKAVAAGAKPVEELADQFWGDRAGLVEDIAGNRWWIATHREDVSTEELVRRAARQG
jgi:uncharacterized glyoxalase superfamily protein PhnB